jgi:hypothetical protein
MNMWEAIVLIVIITSVAKMIRGRHLRIGPGDRFGQAAAQPPAADQAALRREVEDLRNRIKVLERIVTDGRQRHDLADEIEALRDR